MEQAPKCSCGNQSVKKEFATFKYYYCSACKIEVGHGTPVKPITPLWDWDSKKPLPTANLNKAIIGSLPAGYCALKGESVTCCNCGTEHGSLRQDLPEGLTQYRTFGGSGSFIDFNTLGKCCDDMSIDRYNASHCFTEYHVKGRGWV